MYEQEFQGDVLYMMLYAVVAALNLVACCYLLFRRANAIAPDITSSVRLRRWTAAFFAAMTLSHVWYMPIAFLTSSEDILMSYQVGALLDSMTLLPLAVIVLLAMLQDHRRPLWPVAMMFAPLVVGMTWCVFCHSDALMPILHIYILLLGIGLVIYMVRATREYGRWLCDNYADLEHKEVWQSFVVLAVIILVFGIYSFAIKGIVLQYVQQMNDIILTCYLLWRVETLSDLSIAVNDAEEETGATENVEDNVLPLSIRNNIGPLLKIYCEEQQLYLQHDITVSYLAKLIGTNRVYLSQYFLAQGTNYKAYINGLRIQHFINLYHESAATLQPMTTKELAYQSGFRSYSTFSAVFKEIMGMTATEWMRSNAE